MRYQLYQKRPVLMFFSIKFTIEWAINEASTIILKFFKNWIFNGRLESKVPLCRSKRKPKFPKKKIHRISYNWWNHRFSLYLDSQIQYLKSPLYYPPPLPGIKQGAGSRSTRKIYKGGEISGYSIQNFFQCNTQGLRNLFW